MSGKQRSRSLSWLNNNESAFARTENLISRNSLHVDNVNLAIMLTTLGTELIPYNGNTFEWNIKGNEMKML